MNEHEIDVIGIDAPCMDFLVNVNKIPASNDSTLLNESSWQGGGKVATALITLARLGSRCGIVANLGGDLYGDAIEWDFIRHGVDVSHLHRIAGHSTSLSLVLSEKETMGRNIIWQGGSTPFIDKLDADYLRQVKFLHVAEARGIFKEAMKTVRDAGGKVAIDADGYSLDTMNNLNLIDVFIGSEFFFNNLANGRSTEECCREIIKQGPETAVFTFGEKGCAGIGTDGHFFTVPAYRVPVVDTVGAGDVFHGAFIHGLLQGWDAKTCAEWGSAVSAIKVTRIGGRAGLPSADAVRIFMDTGILPDIDLNERTKWYSNSLENTLKECGLCLRK